MGQEAHKHWPAHPARSHTVTIINASGHGQVHLKEPISPQASLRLSAKYKVLV